MRATSVLASTAVILLSCVSHAGDVAPTSLNPGTPRFPYLWPGGVIPYVIDPDVPRPERIYRAMAQWSSATPIRMVPRSRQRNYVRFVRQNNDGLCFSSIGMLGGEQRVKTDDRCNTGTLTHELGHTIGLWHQQSRPDRDRYVRVLYQNIRETSARDFDVQMSDEPAIRPYDYGSIMHYGPYADSEESRGKTIETIPPGIPIGQRERISPGDADGVTRMYGLTPRGVTITTFSPGLTIIVDGETYTAPQTFDWMPGSHHLIEAPAGQSLGDTRYEFGRWNDDGAAAHSIVASHDLTVYAANFIRVGRVTTIGRLHIPKPTPTGN
ncbi:MAG: M12 family metallopeptidase [Bryobacteraceae bacterium]